MRTFARGALLGTLSLGLALASAPAPVRAEMIGTEQMLSAQSRADDIDTVRSFMSRDAVAAELERFGVDPVQARDRVAALSEQELRQLADGIRSEPAGAGVLEVIGVVFLVLLILELVGVTNIFSRI